MKRLQIMIDEEADVALDRLARAERTSKAALVRRFVGERIGQVSRLQDPLFSMIGADDYEPEEVDSVVYR